MEQQRNGNEQVVLEGRQEEVMYNHVKGLYEQAKLIWKGLLFEILLDPVNPGPGELPERHIIDYQNCMADPENQYGRVLSLNELFIEIERLNDYKTILNAALDSIAAIREKYKDRYTVTLLSVMDHTNQVNQENLGDEADRRESEGESEPEEEWESLWESDSGMESPLDYEPHSLLYFSESDSEIEAVSDSGLQTESEGEGIFDWDSDVGSFRSSTPEPEPESDEELGEDSIVDVEHMSETSVESCKTVEEDLEYDSESSGESVEVNDVSEVKYYPKAMEELNSTVEWTIEQYKNPDSMIV